MNQERIYKVILAPHVSEKTMVTASAAGQHVFKVAVDAEKSEIKIAIETLFKVKVAKVRVVNVKGKSKRHGARTGSRSDWKKAYVTLQDGQQLDIENLAA